MNKERRKEIARLAALVDTARGMLQDAREGVEAVKDEETEYKDAMPESLQGGEKGDKAQAAIDALEELDSEFDQIDSSIDTIIEKLGEAAE